MIQWNRNNVLNLLYIFGDAKEHEWMEVINLGTRLFLSVPISKRYKTHQDKFEDFFKKAVNYGLVDKLETRHIELVKAQSEYQIDEKDYVYKISAKGDHLLRWEQAKRTGDYAYFQNYDRTVDGSHGIDHYAPLTPTDYGVKEKHSYKIKDLGK